MKCKFRPISKCAANVQNYLQVMPKAKAFLRSCSASPHFFGETFEENTLAYNRSFRAIGVAVIAGWMLAIASATIGAAATKEEVAHCRAIQQLTERLVCFKSLKRGPKAKMEHAPSDTADDTTKPKADDPMRSPSSDDPATTGSIDHLTSFAPGQPLCVDRDALAAMILAGLLTSDPTKAATRGCQSIPDGAKLELLERYPGVFPFMRMVRVKVTSPTQPELTSGFTIEMGR
jgi:hypothetical protein